MMNVLGVAGAALLGGAVAGLAGGLVELVRALSNRKRRFAILHRGLRANWRQFVA
jgi:hypothetical protein